jgi:hypothetical protein
LGDSYITLKGVEYINANKLIFDVYHKLSGRYYIGDDFKLELIDKEIPTFKDSTHNPGNNIMTCFYSIPYAYLNEYHTNIMNTVHFMKYRSDVPVEDYFPNLFKTKKLIPWEMKIGIYGIVAPCTQRITQIW